MSKKEYLTTAISMVEPGKINIRGYDLTKLMGSISFGDMIYLLFCGDLPRSNEGRMIEAILVCGAEHGLATPSTNAVRSVASCGVPMQAAVAAGIICLGDFHGGAIEKCAALLQRNLTRARQFGCDAAADQIVAEEKEKKQRIQGYGHGIHQPEDPRVVKIFQLAQQYGIADDHIQLAQAIQAALARINKRPLPLNVDGAIAAIISDLGIDWRYGKAFFFLARAAGLAAHAHEQATGEKPMRRVYRWDEVNYTGNTGRTIEEIR
jgi:citrate synthase